MSVRNTVLNAILDYVQERAHSSFHWPKSLAEQGVAKTVVHRLDLGIVLQSVGAELAADTRLLEATEGGLVGDQVVAVDPDGTAMRLAGNG